MGTGSGHVCEGVFRGACWRGFLIEGVHKRRYKFEIDPSVVDEVVEVVLVDEVLGDVGDLDFCVYNQ